jgi:septal ring factor EnvC (AmiA/AmiB activator)
MAKENNNSNIITNSNNKNINQVQNNYAKKDSNSKDFLFSQLFQQIADLKMEINSLKEEIRNKAE